MKIVKGQVSNLGSCNFCTRGSLTENGLFFRYDYKKVFKIEGENISIRFCENCINEVLSKIVSDSLMSGDNNE